MPVTRTRLIRSLNDGFRQSFKGGIIYFTPAVFDLPPLLKGAALARIATGTPPDFKFVDREHKELVFELASHPFKFTVLYYHPTLRKPSEKPEDRRYTRRFGRLSLQWEKQ
jgi:hypothetical protein